MRQVEWGPEAARWLDALREGASADERVLSEARRIVEAVRDGGEAAVLDYTERFDGVRPAALRLDDGARRRLAAQVPASLRAILEQAARNIEAFHRPQRLEAFRVGPCRQLVRALDTVGLYVPGGRAAYPSTVLMSAIPARVAGVRRVVMATPPGPDGEVLPAVAAAAEVAGVDDLFLMGGAQAVAAFAYGAGPVPRVDKIAGPGNAWVAAAKRLVSGRVGVDLEAGPSEVLVLADDSADPALVARDLVAQAEHDPRAICVCVTTSARVHAALPRAVADLLAAEPNPVAAESLAATGGVILAPTLEAALEAMERFAPEHLELAVTDPEALLPQIRNAGVVFCGEWSPAPLGDYLAGPNHTLPTAGFARFQSALSVTDFQKRVNVVSWDEADLRRDGPAVADFARAEGLVGHARAVEARLERPEGVLARPDPARFVRDAVLRQTPYTLEESGPVRYKLDQNEAPEGLPEAVRQAVVDRAASHPWEVYPGFDPAPWRTRVAETAGWRGDGVLLGNGSNDLLLLLFRAVCGPGDRVVLPVPCFSLYPLHLDVVGATLDRIPAGPGFAFDEEALVAAARGAKMVLLSSPCNPTGRTLRRSTVERLLETGALVVVDEAYVEFSDQDLVPLLGEDVPLVLLRTFSKAWAAAALRAGALFGPPSFCAALDRIRLPYSIPAFTLAGIEVLLEHRELVDDRVGRVRRDRARVLEGLGRLGFDAVPSEANFVLFSTMGRSPSGLQAALEERGVRIRDVSGYVPGHLRVSIGGTEACDAFLAALADVVGTP